MKKELYDGELVDVFSSGVVLFAMITGALPFEWARTSDKIYSLLIQEQYQEFWDIFASIAEVSPEAKDLIQGMLKYDPRERFRLSQIERHEWIDNNTKLESAHQEDTKERYQKRKKTKAIAKKKSVGAQSTEKNKRGKISTGDEGGTDPYCITEEDFEIAKEDFQAYKHDLRIL